MEALLANPPQANGLTSPALLATPPGNCERLKAVLAQTEIE
jgi:hypothetical protein